MISYKRLILGIVALFQFSAFISFAQTTTIQVEAELGVLSGVTTATSGDVTYVTGFDIATDQLTVSVTVPAKGFYKILINYRSSSGDKTQFIAINNGGVSPVIFPIALTFTDLDAGKYLLNKGVNTITIKNSWGYVDLNKFTLSKADKNTYEITASLVDPNASEATKNLYGFLLANFGKKVISGQTSDNYDEIKALTQNAPLLRAYDFQHYTQGYPYLWKDGGHSFGYDDDGTVDKAIQWYNSTDKKGLVSFQWHWHSPSGGTAGTNTFYTNQTSFDVTKAVQAGTEENKMILRDIDSVASQLKKMSNAGVPVLWRPLHEAGGAWFWWGAKGPEACKTLYDIVFDRMMNHHGLHNLIWVWSSPEADWYPGNDKVDIVGHDSYPGEFNYSTQKNTFDILHRITNGKKLIAMTENGPIPNPNECLAYDSPWSYFMSWSNLVKEQNSDAHLVEVYTNPRVLSFGSNYNYDTVALEEPEDPTTGIRTFEGGKIKVYPNPVNYILQIEGNVSAFELSNMEGKVIYRGQKTKSIPVGAVKNGTYNLTIYSNNQIHRGKIIVDK